MLGIRRYPWVRLRGEEPQYRLKVEVIRTGEHRNMSRNREQWSWPQTNCAQGLNRPYCDNPVKYNSTNTSKVLLYAKHYPSHVSLKPSQIAEKARILAGLGTISSLWWASMPGTEFDHIFLYFSACAFILHAL